VPYAYLEHARRSRRRFTPPHSRRDPTVTQMTSSHVPVMSVMCAVFGSGHKGPKAVLRAVSDAKVDGFVLLGPVRVGAVGP
jgi:hypothetical protein